MSGSPRGISRTKFERHRAQAADRSSLRNEIASPPRSGWISALLPVARLATRHLPHESNFQKRTRRFAEPQLRFDTETFQYHDVKRLSPEEVPLRISALLASLTAFTGSLAFAAADSNPTFSKDIAPIFQRSCDNCHREGSIAPMSLLTYKDARPWARSIKEKVARRQMPPWHIDRNVGINRFKDDPSLTDAEIATIV